MKKRRAISRDQLEQVPHGTRIMIAGLVLSRQRPMTASGVVFITLEDETGMINVIVTPDLFERSRRLAVHSRLLFVSGKVERTPRTTRVGEHPVIHVLAEKLEALHMKGGLESRSRDFR